MRGRQLVYLHEDQRNFTGIETTYFFSPESQMRLKVIIRTSIKFASAKSEKKMFEANSVDSVLISSCVQ